MGMKAAHEKLRSFRRRMGLKQWALADLLGIDQATVSRWERGSRPVDARIWRTLVEMERSRDPATFHPTPGLDLDPDDHWPVLLKHYRANRDISQEQLAEIIGCTASSVCRWECGLCRPSLGSQIRLSAVILSCDETYRFFRNRMRRKSRRVAGS